jgi:hypothetical protein
MLKMNQHLDQLSAARVEFTKWGMLDGTLLESVLKPSGAYYIQNFIFDLSNFKFL